MVGGSPWAGLARAPVELGSTRRRRRSPRAAAPVHDLRRVLDAQDLAGGIARAVEPQQFWRGRTRQGPSAVSESTGTGVAPAGGRHVIRRVGGSREGDDIAGAKTEQGGQPGDQFLGPDGGQNAVGVEPSTPRRAARTRSRRPSRRSGVAMGLGVAGASAAARRASWTTWGVGSTGVPMERSIRPRRANSPAPCRARASPRKVGQ